MRKPHVTSQTEAQPGAPFRGEIMICKICGVQKKHEPGRDSEWTAVQIEGREYFTYFCPNCFGNADLK